MYLTTLKAFGNWQIFKFSEHEQQHVLDKNLGILTHIFLVSNKYIFLLFRGLLTVKIFLWNDTGNLRLRTLLLRSEYKLIEQEKWNFLSAMTYLTKMNPGSSKNTSGMEKGVANTTFTFRLMILYYLNFFPSKPL